ncbi:MAG: diacylglycerol kinase family protein [Candidatus Saccharimonadales bacterium]
MSDKPEVIATDDHTRRVHPYTGSSFFQSVTHSLHGLRHIVRHERNARVHLAMAVLALLIGLELKVRAVELAAVFFAVIIVFLAEIFNTAIERTLDMIDGQENPRIKLIKDMSAGAVLVAATAALIVGAAIFIPYIWEIIWPS